MTDKQAEIESGANKSWLLAFKDIFFKPANIPSRAPFPVGKVAAIGLLLYITSAMLVAFINDSHSGLRHQNFQMRAKAIEMAQKNGNLNTDQAGKQLKDLEESYRFVFSTALQGTLLIGVMWLLFTALLIWVFQNIIFKGPLTFSYTLAFVSFGNAIDAAGNLFKTLLHAAAGTLHVDPSLGFFSDMYENPMLFGFLNRVDIFTIWQYIAIALAIAAYVGAERRRAYILAACVIVVVIFYFGAGAFFGSMLVA